MFYFILQLKVFLFQTPLEVEPVQIWPPKELVKVYEHLGVNDKLGLRGRPNRPIGALGTSKVCETFSLSLGFYPYPTYLSG